MRNRKGDDSLRPWWSQVVPRWSVAARATGGNPLPQPVRRNRPSAFQIVHWSCFNPVFRNSILGNSATKTGTATSVRHAQFNSVPEVTIPGCHTMPQKPSMLIVPYNTFSAKANRNSACRRIKSTENCAAPFGYAATREISPLPRRDCLLLFFN